MRRNEYISWPAMQSMPPPRWLIREVIQTPSLAVLFGAPSNGKTFVALDIALSITTGTAGILAPTTTGPVAYIAGEGLSDMHQRIQAWKSTYHATPDNFYLYPIAVNFLNRQALENFCLDTDELGIAPILIVIDTMARCMGGGDENSVQDVSKFIQGCDKLITRYKCSILIVHHTLKDDPETERGSSALRGAADTLILLHKNSHSLRMICKKQKAASEFETIELQREEVDLDEENSSLIMRVITPPADNDTKIVQLLAANPDGMKFSALKKLCISVGLNRSAFERGLIRLKAQGIVYQDEKNLYRVKEKL